MMNYAYGNGHWNGMKWNVTTGSVETKITLLATVNKLHRERWKNSWQQFDGHCAYNGHSEINQKTKLI